MCYIFGCMQLNKYPFVKTEENHRYEFNSKGPKGIVRKIVIYDTTNFEVIPIFNLVFGDWDPLTGRPDDTVVTNNNDRKKVLSTVAATVLEFMRERPNAAIYAKGSTLSRTRLYRMGIALIWDEIKEEMDLFGRLNGRWYDFTKCIDYDAFIIAHKRLNFNPNYKNLLQ